MSEQEKLPVVEKPPFFKKWGQLYGFVIGWLVFLIVLFYLFSLTYA